MNMIWFCIYRYMFNILTCEYDMKASYSMEVDVHLNACMLHVVITDI